MKKKIEGQEMETPGKAIYNLRSFKCLPQIMFDNFFYMYSTILELFFA